MRIALAICFIAGIDAFSAPNPIQHSDHTLGGSLLEKRYERLEVGVDYAWGTGTCESRLGASGSSGVSDSSVYGAAPVDHYAERVRPNPQGALPARQPSAGVPVPRKRPEGTIEPNPTMPRSAT